MFLNVNRVKGFGIDAADGDIGRLKEFYFDDKECVIRYLVVDTGRFLPGKKVLIPRSALRKPDLIKKRIQVDLSKEQVKNSQGIDEHRPVKRERDFELNQYHGWKISWAEGPEVLLPADVEPDLDSYGGDPHLQSTDMLTGFHIQTPEGEVGRLDDFVLDDAAWDIRYYVAEIGTRLPGRKVLMCPQWIQKINQRERKVLVNLALEKIKTGPEYNQSTPITKDYEEEMLEHYGCKKASI